MLKRPRSEVEDKVSESENRVTQVKALPSRPKLTGRAMGNSCTTNRELEFLAAYAKSVEATPLDELFDSSMALGGAPRAMFTAKKKQNLPRLLSRPTMNTQLTEEVKEAPIDFNAKKSR